MHSLLRPKFKRSVGKYAHNLSFKYMVEKNTLFHLLTRLQIWSRNINTGGEEVLKSKCTYVGRKYHILWPEKLSKHVRLNLFVTSGARTIVCNFSYLLIMQTIFCVSVSFSRTIWKHISNFTPNLVQHESSNCSFSCHWSG